MDAIIINEEQHQDISNKFFEAKLCKEPFGVISNHQAGLSAATSLTRLDSSKLIIAPRYCPVSQ